MLICPVRDCRLPLVREEKRLVCARAHSFDVARSGYVNLLQPQDKKSKNPGDTLEAVAARRRLHDRGVSAPLLLDVANLLSLSSADSVLDVGCGEGFYLGSLAQRTGCAGHGIDISIPAIDAAAKRYPGNQWIVANADRAIPYADASFSVLMSITARMNADESRRVLREGGKLLVAVASPDDLIELRGAGKERVARTVETFSKEFRLVGQTQATSEAELDSATVQDLFHSIYRPMQAQPVVARRVTFSLDLLLFQTA